MDSSILPASVKLSNTPLIATPISDASLHPEMSKAASEPSVIYHQGEEELPAEMYNNKGITVRHAGTYESTEDFKARSMEAFLLFVRGIPDAASDLKLSYDSVSSKLDSALLDKNWDFSLGKDNEFVIVDRSNSLSKSETDLILETLNDDNYLKHTAGVFADQLIKALELDRGPNKVSNNMPKYDVTRDNFEGIVFLRDYLEAPDQENDKDLSGTFNGFYMHLGMSILASQFAARAEPKYSIENFLKR